MMSLRARSYSTQKQVIAGEREVPVERFFLWNVLLKLSETTSQLFHFTIACVQYVGNLTLPSIVVVFYIVVTLAYQYRGLTQPFMTG